MYARTKCNICRLIKLFLNRTKNLVFGFGDLMMKSKTDKNKSRKAELQNLARTMSSREGMTDKVLKEMRSQSYHQYQIELRHMQVTPVYRLFR